MVLKDILHKCNLAYLSMPMVLYWLVEQKNSALMIFTSTASEHLLINGFVRILSSSRLILLYSGHLEGRQTVENHASCSYGCLFISTDARLWPT